MSTALRKIAFGLIATAALLAACVRMGEPDDVFLVANQAVLVFTTKQQSMHSSLGSPLAVLQPKERVPVLDCIDVGEYQVFEVRLADGRTGFVNDGDYRLRDEHDDSTWCGSNPHNPQLERGWVTNCAGPDFSKFAHNGAPGPGPDRPLFRINDQLVLAVPKEHRPDSEIIPREPITCTKVSDLPEVHWVEFLVQGDWSAGYEPKEIPNDKGGLKQFRPDRVWVRIEAESWRDENFTLEHQREINQEIDQHTWRFANPDGASTFEVGALTCTQSYCYGSANKNKPDVPRFNYHKYAYTSFVLVQGDYPSSRYGRIHVYWQAWTSDISHGTDIDDTVWKTLAEWNVPALKEPQSGPRS